MLTEMVYNNCYKLKCLKAYSDYHDCDCGISEFAVSVKFRNTMLSGQQADNRLVGS